MLWEPKGRRNTWQWDLTDILQGSLAETLGKLSFDLGFEHQNGFL